MTLSALGIFSAAGAGGVPFASDYELIETQILGSSQSGITFSSLGTYSSTYKHLQIRTTIRASLAAATETISIRINGDTGSSYTQHGLGSSGSTVFSYSASPAVVNSGAIGSAPGSTTTANTFSGSVIDILDAFSTSKTKVFRALTGFSTSSNGIALTSGAWLSTASITSINIYAGNANFVAGTRMSIYGVK